MKTVSIYKSPCCGPTCMHNISKDYIEKVIINTTKNKALYISGKPPWGDDISLIRINPIPYMSHIVDYMAKERES